MSTATEPIAYLTQFPATALTGHRGLPVDWTDHAEAHRAISRLFPSKLPGGSRERRATSSILYRLDPAPSGQEASVLVQSLVPPELTPPASRTTSVSHRAFSVQPGDRVAFRVAVNPVKRTTRYFADAAKKQPLADAHVARAAGARSSLHMKQTASVVQTSELPGWIAAKLSPGLEAVTLVSHVRSGTFAGTGAGRHKIVVDTLDGLASVGSVDALAELRLHGVGRQRAYGCGLLTIARVHDR